MITAVSAAALEHKDLSIKLATQFRLSVVYAYRVLWLTGFSASWLIAIFYGSHLRLHNFNGEI